MKQIVSNENRFVSIKETKDIKDTIIELSTYLLLSLHNFMQYKRFTKHNLKGPRNFKYFGDFKIPKF